MKPTVLYLNYREGDQTFNWGEAERIAALPAFDVLKEMQALRTEVGNG